VVVGLLYRFANLNAVAAFWIAYVLTRPLGASTGDLLSQATKGGGLGLGTTATSAIFLFVILVLVTVLSIRQRRHRRAHDAGIANDAMIAGGRDVDLAVAP
jgi:uncharacterized membrane-anchored protein